MGCVTRFDATVEGRYGDAAAYYSSLGGVWDVFWLGVTLVFASKALRRDYFREVIVPADPRVWAWIHRTFRLPEQGLVLLYRGFLFYGLGRMSAWFLYARFGARTPFQAVWGGPRYVAGADLSDAGFPEVLARTAVGGVLFALFLWLCWRMFVQRLWARGQDPPMVQRGAGLRAAFH